MEKKTAHLLAVLFGVLASVMIVLAIGVYEAFIGTAQVGGASYGELGVLAFVLIAAAVGVVYLE